MAINSKQEGRIIQLEDYERYRNAQMNEALRYQDFVVDLCYQELGLPIVLYCSKEYQIHSGESRTGVEIKQDSMMAKTGNLWIEVAEKARPRIGDYAVSGVRRSDNSWLWIQGDYNTVYVFFKRFLASLASSGRYDIRENNTKTSQGFLLPIADAEKYAGVVLRPNAAHRFTADTGEIPF